MNAGHLSAVAIWAVLAAELFMIALLFRRSRPTPIAPGAAAKPVEHLTDEEKGRIRAEMLLREEIRTELKAGAQGARWNSPLVVALFTAIAAAFSAIAVAGAGYFTQIDVADRQAREARDATSRRALQDKKYALLGAFAAQAAPHTMALNRKLREEALLGVHPPKDPLRRTRSVVERLYERDVLSYQVTSSIYGTLAQMAAVFHSPSVTAHVKDYEDAEDRWISKRQTKDEIELETLHDQLIHDMGAEIREDARAIHTTGGAP